jgi:hypothetical protein
LSVVALSRVRRSVESAVFRDVLHRGGHHVEHVFEAEGPRGLGGNDDRGDGEDSREEQGFAHAGMIRGEDNFKQLLAGRIGGAAPKLRGAAAEAAR